MPDMRGKSGRRRVTGPTLISLVYAVLAGVWILLSGAYLSHAIGDPDLLWRLELAKGLAFVAVTSLLLHWLLRHREAPKPALAPGPDEHTMGRGALAAILALLLLIPLIGYGVLHFYSPVIQRQAVDDLRAITQLQADQISLWRRERVQDIAALTGSQTFLEGVRRLREPENRDAARAELRDRLEAVRAAYDYRAILLLGADGETLVRVGREGDFRDSSASLLERVKAGAGPIQGRLELDEAGAAHLDFLVPLTGDAPATSQSVTLVLRANPKSLLIPFDADWWGDRPATRTVLARREAGALRILGERDSGPGAALLEGPKSGEAPTVEWVAAGANRGGVVDGRDMAGNDVFAVHRPLEGLGWTLVTKMDRAGALAPLRELGQWLSVGVLLAMAVISAVLLLVWRRQGRLYQTRLMAHSLEHERALRRQEAVYREMFEANPHPMWVFDSETLRFLAVNEAAIEHYGYSRDEFLAMTIMDIRPQEDGMRLREHIAYQLVDGMDRAGVWRHCKRDGTLIHVEVSAHPLEFEGRPAELVLAYDVSEREELEAQLSESERFFRAVIDALALRIAVLDEAGDIIAVNRVWREFVRHRSGAVQLDIGTSYVEAVRRAAARGNRYAADFLHGLEDVRACRVDSFTLEYPWPSPSEKSWFLVHVTRFPGEGPQRLVVSHKEITQRKLAEVELHKLNRYYAALSAMNASIIRIREPQQIFEEACRIAVEHGELELVWVGRFDAETKRVEPVAYSGPQAAYLDEVDITLDPADPAGQGPVAMALRTGEVQVENHFGADRVDVAWHNATGARGLQSVLVCPIVRREGVWGCIAFYAGREDYFSQALTRLLGELTADLAFSLDTIDIERGRAEVEADLLLNAKVIESSHEGMYITDSANRMIMVNRALCRITGYSDDELLGREPGVLSSQRHEADFYRGVWSALEETGQWEGELWGRRKDGEVYPIWLSLTRVYEEISGEHKHIAIYRDISERKAYEERIRHLASHDVLTDLPNRVILDDRIETAIARARRSGAMVAVLFVDLDRFKLVNDTLGHRVGDSLLKEVAGRIQGALRASDTASRVGGDEFMVLLPDLHALEDAAIVAEKIIKQVSQPCQVDHHSLVVTASVGIALYPDNGEDVAALKSLADTAMMSAKHAGNNRYQFYAGEMGRNAAQYLEMQNALRYAVERGELFLVYQPQLALADERLVGAEALLRWRSDQYGLVSPGVFIPIAEDSGMIVEIGVWVLREACRQAREWQVNGLTDVPVSVNVSALQFRQDDFVERVREALSLSGLPAANLELEVTESLLMTHVDDVIQRLGELQSLGVRLAIDDFGTGYSSLSYLQSFSAQRLKVDQSFVQGLENSPDAAAIVRAIVGLGRSLGMTTIAEGVETPEQAQFLRRLGCDEVQGFFFSYPLEVPDFEAWVAERAEPGGRR